MRLVRTLAAVLVASSVVLTGCAVNPVTGESEFSLLTPAQEVAIGEQQYLPAQQSQGGAYNVDPGLNTYINQVGQKLAKVSDNPNLPYEFVVLNNDVPNAWALPGGKIAINRGLLYLLEDESQLAAVLGHEIVHAAARHGAAQQTRQVLLGIGGGLIQSLGDAYGFGDTAGQAASLGVGAISARYSQGHELQSDAVGMDYMARAGYEPLGAVELQEAFVKLKEGQQTSAFDAFFQSHPPSQTRVSKNLEKARNMPSGERNRAQYLAATEQIRADKPAYDLHQEALAAASKEELNTALSKVKEAIQLQNKESHFWNTQGRIQQALEQTSAASSSFDRAVALNPNYFANYLYRGIARVDNKQYAGASADMEKSLALLPTQIATYFLGVAKIGEGDYAAARQHLTSVQQSGGQLGQAAAEQLNAIAGK